MGFDYDADSTYASIASLSFEKNQFCTTAEIDSGASVGRGQKTNTGTDSETEKKIDSTTLAILWSLLLVFIVACLVFTGVYIYKWKHKHVASVHVNLHSKEVDLEEDPTVKKGSFGTL